MFHKLKKNNYSKSKIYKLITLLNILNKILKTIIGWRRDSLIR